jgi:uncharacterized protein YhbP (UPF0306 family)
MTIERSTRAFSQKRMAAVARRLLDSSTLCAISTISPGGRAHVNTAYFSFDEEFRLVWLSDPQARHSLNLGRNGTAAIAVFDSRQTWGKPDRGIQLFGTAAEAVGAVLQSAERTYAQRFPTFTLEEYSAYRLYVFRPRRIKLFDEPELGGGTFVTVNLTARGRLTWSRTEIQHAT